MSLLLLAVARYKLAAEFLIALALLGTGLHYWSKYIEGVRNEGRIEIRAAWDVEKLRQQTAARAKESQLQQDKDAAVRQADSRSAALAAALYGLRADLGKLRTEQTTRATPALIAGATDAAIRQYATTLRELFGECAARYSDVAAKADGHASDEKTLTDAWPK